VKGVEELKKALEEGGKKNKKLMGYVCGALAFFLLVVMSMFGNPFGS
jgi:hypothetical protein